MHVHTHTNTHTHTRRSGVRSSSRRDRGFGGTQRERERDTHTHTHRQTHTHTLTHAHTPRGVCPTVAEAVEAGGGGTGALLLGAVKGALLSVAVSPRTRVSPAALSARTRALASLALSLLRCAQVSKETDYRSKRDLLRSKRGLR